MQIDQTLLPLTAHVAGNGHLEIGGCDVTTLAEQYGTPLYIYDEQHIRQSARTFRKVFGNGNVAYASKAFLCKAIVDVIREEGLMLDVASGGEMHIALAAGMPGDQLVLHGNNKSKEELRLAIENRVNRIVVDSFDELDRLDQLTDELGRSVSVLIRITPGVEAHTHEYRQTGTENSKFGFTLNNDVALNAIKQVAAHEHLDFAGLHCHIGSQVSRADGFRAAIKIVMDFVGTIATEYHVREIDFGGGFAIRYESADEDFAIEKLGVELIEAAQAAAQRVGLPEAPRIVVEPGRAIVGNAAIAVYRVGTIKEIPGVNTYVSVDGGLSDNPRHALYGARYEFFTPEHMDRQRTRNVSVAGLHCEQGDILGRDVPVPNDIRVGDLLATPASGAYQMSMASNYNKVRRPAVIFVNNGEAWVVVRRESYDDLLRLDS